MPTLPPLVSGKVVGRLLAGVPDGPDLGVAPENPPLVGQVHFRSDVPSVVVPSGSPSPAIVIPRTYTADLDADGYLVWRGKRGIHLIAPTPATVNPSGWTWTVSFDLSHEGEIVTYPAFHIFVPQYTPGPDPDDPDVGSVGLVDLALVAPAPASVGDFETGNFMLNFGGVTGAQRVTESEYAAMELAGTVDPQVLYVGFPG